MLVVALAGCTCVLAAAQAQTMRFARYHIGLGANFAAHEYQIPGASNVRGDDAEAGFHVFGGADIDPRWGAEVGYANFSESDFGYTQGFLPARGTVSGYGVYVAAKRRWPIHRIVDVYAKLGIAYSHRKLESTLPLTTAPSNHDTGVYAGAGLQWNINRRIALVGEYERYGRSKRIGSSADVFTVSARFSF
jgi:OOP family OmpA-OmpF porin